MTFKEIAETARYKLSHARRLCRFVEGGQVLLAVKKIERNGGTYRGYRVRDLHEAVVDGHEKRLHNLIKAILDEHHNQDVTELRRRCRECGVPYYSELDRAEMIRILEDIEDADR